MTAPDPAGGDRLLAVQLADCRVDLQLAHPVVSNEPTRRVVLRISAAAEDGACWVSSDGQRAHCADEAATVAHVLTTLNEQVLLTSSLLTVHAGVVRAEHGAIAWPAASGSGKSTLVAAALLRGYGYLSDEALCLAIDGRAVPYPKPVTLDPWAVATLGLDGLRTGDGSEELAFAPHAVGAQVESAPAAVAAVVLLSREDKPSLRPAGSDEAVAALLRHSFNHWRMPGAAVEAVHRAVETAAVYRLGYDDPRDGAELLVGELPPPSSSTVVK